MSKFIGEEQVIYRTKGADWLYNPLNNELTCRRSLGDYTKTVPNNIDDVLELVIGVEKSNTAIMKNLEKYYEEF